MKGIDRTKAETQHFLENSSKPHTFSTFFGEEKKRKNAFTLSNQAT